MPPSCASPRVVHEVALCVRLALLFVVLMLPLVVGNFMENALLSAPVAPQVQSHMKPSRMHVGQDPPRLSTTHSEQVALNFKCKVSVHSRLALLLLLFPSASTAASDLIGVGVVFA